MLTSVLAHLLPDIYTMAGYNLQEKPADVQKADANAITLVRGFGTEIADRPLITVVRNGGSPLQYWWLGNKGVELDGTQSTVMMWPDSVEVVWEVPASQGGEVFLDELVQVYVSGILTELNRLQQPPPYGYGLYNPRWFPGAVAVAPGSDASGHWLYRNTGQFSADVPVAAGVQQPRLTRIQFEVTATAV